MKICMIKPHHKVKHYQNLYVALGSTFDPTRVIAWMKIPGDKAGICIRLVVNDNVLWFYAKCKKIKIMNSALQHAGTPWLGQPSSWHLSLLGLEPLEVFQIISWAASQLKQHLSHYTHKNKGKYWFSLQTPLLPRLKVEIQTSLAPAMNYSSSFL